jgi:hypothetical protein
MKQSFNNGMQLKDISYENKMLQYLEKPDLSFLEECEGYISHTTEFINKINNPSQDT